MSESPVFFEVRDKVLTITLNRPEKLNPIADDMTFAIVERLQEAEQDDQIGAILLTGAGRAFCAGGDVSNMAGRKSDGSPPSFEWTVDHQRRKHELPYLLHTLPKVTIAAVNGHAVGAGLGIAASCDLRLASTSSKFGTAFANVGLGGDFGTTWQLTRLLGESKAKELFFLPDILNAETAHELGLVNRILPAESFMDSAHEIATRIANGPLVSYRWMKENVNAASLTDFRTSLYKEAVTHHQCAQTNDHNEGVDAFMNKRKPSFSGR